MRLVNFFIVKKPWIIYFLIGLFHVPLNWRVFVNRSVIRGKKTQTLIATSWAAIIWSIWKFRNDACFKNAFPADQVSFIASISHMLQSWNCLQRRQLGDRQQAGTRSLLVVANSFFNRNK
jgi:hypothetical protein